MRASSAFLALVLISWFLPCFEATARKVTTIVMVLDDYGNAVSGAVVGVSSSIAKSDGWGSDLLYKEDVTDQSGRAAIRQKCDSFVIAAARKEGYYESNSGQILVRALDENNRVVNTNPTIFLPLREIKNPTPMYACRIIDLKLPHLNEACSLDLLARDWVAPFGKGAVTDITFVVSQLFAQSGKQTGSTCLVSFPNPGDGVLRVKDEEVIWQSSLVLPREAPLDGYTNEVSRWLTWGSDRGYVGNERDDSGYFMRIRSVMESGRVVRALYGKIRGDFRFSARPERDKPRIALHYYVNPESNSRNIEFDPKRNLFTGLKGMEAVREP